MNEKNDKHVIDILFVIALFCGFVVSAAFLITIGAKVYSQTISNMNSNFDSRTAVAYIIEKVHHSDSNGDISVGLFDDVPAIIIESDINNKEYLTYIYEYDGVLKELLVRKDISLSPMAGNDIIPISSFSLESVNERLIRCFIESAEGESFEFYISTHTKTSDLGGADNE